MIIRRAVLSSALLLLALAFDACGRNETVTPPGRSALSVSITGLPAGQAAAVTVAGPASFSQSLTQAATLNDLDPGSYTISASAVTAGGATYTPSPATQSVAIAAGETASRTVMYSTVVPTLRLIAQQVVQGLSNPVYLVAPPNDPRLFIVEQPGRIRIYKNGALLSTPFLDITSRVNFGGERGLLSMAFDPAYATNGRFYVYYTGSQGDIFVDRHTVSTNADVANTAFQQVITIQHRDAGNHNGGHALFGPDGMLYLGTGDGGGGGDPQQNGQNINSLLGKLIRINVANLPYTIPSGNPFVNQFGADEIWAYGLRNPWRFAFDGTGSAAQLFIADVGQGAWEEVNAVDAGIAGVNYGWRTMEGAHCFNPSSGCNQSGLTLPVHEYNHSDGCSITGGFVYRGAAIPELHGHYFYADYCDGWVRSFRLSGGVATDHRTWAVGDLGNITSFGVDGAGEIYVLSGNGRVYRVVRQ